jgi:hypothetical protein
MARSFEVTRQAIHRATRERRIQDDNPEQVKLPIRKDRILDLRPIFVPKG